jgi:hypothetical protein
MSSANVRILTLLLFQALAQLGPAQTLEAQVEQLARETEVRLLTGELASEVTPQGKIVTERLRQLPPEALQTAVKLLTREDVNEYRLKMVCLIMGLYRTHEVGPETHRQIANVIFDEMIKPKSHSQNLYDWRIGLIFIHKYGDLTDMERLYPLLTHPNPEVRRSSKMTIQNMAANYGLEDPTKAPPAAHDSAEQPTPQPASPRPNPKTSPSRELATPPSTPTPAISTASSRGMWIIGAAALLACAILFVWIGKDRSKER